MPLQVSNHTRYNTEDLEALAAFCEAHAPNQGGSVRPVAIHFFEFSPKKPVKGQRVNRYDWPAPVYGPDYLDLPVKWAKTERNQPGVVWIAAPECWITELGQLVGDAVTMTLPPDAVRMVADAIKSFWHYSNVQASLTLSVRVSTMARTKRSSTERLIVKRNRFVSECDGWISAVRVARHMVATLTHRRKTLQTRASEAMLTDPLHSIDLNLSIASVDEELNRVEMAIRDALTNMRKQEEA